MIVKKESHFSQSKPRRPYNILQSISQTRQRRPYKISKTHVSKTHVNGTVTIELKPGNLREIKNMERN
jgi:hypothetical protein